MRTTHVQSSKRSCQVFRGTNDLDRHVAHGVGADDHVGTLLLQLRAGGLARLDPPHLAALGLRAVGHQ
jgi:hypothetical protein